MSQGNSSPIVGVKAFGLDHGLADQAEATLSTTFGGVGTGVLLQAGGSREDEQFAVGEDAINVK